MRSPVACTLLLLALQGAVSQPTIQTVTKTYRKFVSEDSDPAWVNDKDTLSELGYNMTAVKVPPPGKLITFLDSPYGKMSVLGLPPLYSADFSTDYGIKTVWPYCASKESCPMFTQKTNTLPSTPITILLPRGVSAVDFYTDIAIDCETILAITAVCTATAQPGGVSITTNLESICGAPAVGSYYGFYNPSGTISRVTIKCGSPFPRCVGLLRIGTIPGQELPLEDMITDAQNALRYNEMDMEVSAAVEQLATEGADMAAAIGGAIE